MQESSKLQFQDQEVERLPFHFQKCPEWTYNQSIKVSKFSIANPIISDIACIYTYTWCT